MDLTQASIRDWLEGQLIELDRWRRDLAAHAPGGPQYQQRLEDIDAHRNWLEAQLDQMSRPSDPASRCS